MQRGIDVNIGKNRYTVYWTRKSGETPIYFIRLLGVSGWMIGFNSRIFGSLCVRKQLITTTNQTR